MSESITPAGRGRGIRTPDIQLPKLALYQTELYPVATCGTLFAFRSPRMLRVTPHLVNPFQRTGILSGPIGVIDADGQVMLRASCLAMYMARPERFELPTTKFVAWYSIQLSYGRVEPQIMNRRS